MRRSLCLLLLFLGVQVLGASLPSLQDLERMPQSVEKDYYIWRFLNRRSTTIKEAQTAIRQAWRLNGKLIKAYRKKTGKAPAVLPHRRPPSLSAQEKRRRKYLRELTRRILAASHPLRLWKKLSARERVAVFNAAGRAGRRILDHRPDEREWLEMTLQPGFDRTLSYLLHERPPKLSKALTYPPARGNRLSYRSTMRLGFYDLTHGATRNAEACFADAAAKALKREEADRALFWAWKAGGNRHWLKSLVRSYDINIYTLAARDALGLDYPLGLDPSLPRLGTLPPEVRDPIAWARLKRKIFSPRTDLRALARRYRHAETIGYYTYIMSKASRDKRQYFPMPYRDLLSKLPKTRQAILYAIARQESRFVPASVSSSFALGLMQMMPFLIDHIAKIRHERIDYDALFDPRISLAYANEHMNYLTRWLHHPLFIAYAYNAGIGYTKRLIRRKDLFRSGDGYEPWLSLERIDNEQANDYGKKVLSNYVIYLNKLGVPVRLRDLIAALPHPEKTDRFRRR